MAHRIQVPTSVIDCHDLTELIKSKCTATDFHAPHDAACFDLSNLQIAADGRHAAIHEQKTNLLANWDRYLASMINASRGMGAMSAAKKMARVRSHLVHARNRARTLVSNSRRQQAAGTIGQPVATPSTAVTKGNRRRWIARTRTDSTSTTSTSMSFFFFISFHFSSYLV